MCVCVLCFFFFSQVHVRKEGGSFGGEGGDNWCNWLVTNDTSTEHYTLPIIIERWRRIYGKRKNTRQTHDEDEEPDDDDDSVGSDCRWRQPDGSWKVRQQQQKRKGKNAEYL